MHFLQNVQIMDKVLRFFLNTIKSLIYFLKFPNKRIRKDPYNKPLGLSVSKIEPEFSKDFPIGNYVFHSYRGGTGTGTYLHYTQWGG